MVFGHSVYCCTLAYEAHEFILCPSISCSLWVYFFPDNMDDSPSPAPLFLVPALILLLYLYWSVTD